MALESFFRVGKHCQQRQIASAGITGAESRGAHGSSASLFVRRRAQVKGIEHQLSGISIHRTSNYQPAGAANFHAVSDVTRAISISVMTELGILDLGTLRDTLS